MPPKRKPSANAAAAAAARANAVARANAAPPPLTPAQVRAAASGNAVLSSSERHRLSVQIPNGNGNAIINPATGLPFNHTRLNLSAVSESVPMQRTGKEVSEVPPHFTNHVSSPLSHSAAPSVAATAASAHHPYGTDQSSPHRRAAESLSYRNEGLSQLSHPRHATPAAASSSSAATLATTLAATSEPVFANRNRNVVASSSSSAAASEPAAESLLSYVSEPLKTDAEIDATIIHPHHLERKDDWSSTFKNDRMVPHCDVCGRTGMSVTYRCNSGNCVYDECETCHSVEHRRIRQQLPNSTLPVFTILSNEQIKAKMSFTPHRHDGIFAHELPLIEWKPNEIRRCDICGRLTLKSYHCNYDHPDHKRAYPDGYDECKYCHDLFKHTTTTYKIQKERLKRQIENQARQRIEQLGRGRHSKRNTHRKKANRRTHKRSARR